MLPKSLALLLVGQLGLIDLSSAQACAALWGQCGGWQGTSGPLCCQSGSTCVMVNEFYYQCEPGTASTNPSSASPTPESSVADITMSTFSAAGGSSAVIESSSSSLEGSSATITSDDSTVGGSLPTTRSSSSTVGQIRTTKSFSSTVRQLSSKKSSSTVRQQLSTKKSSSSTVEQLSTKKSSSSTAGQLSTKKSSSSTAGQLSTKKSSSSVGLSTKKSSSSVGLSTKKSSSSTVGQVSTKKSSSTLGTTTATSPSVVHTTSATNSIISHSQSPYPVPSAADSCGDWKLVDNVCCPEYCSDLLSSQSCDYPASTCGSCITPPSEDCKSGSKFNHSTSIGADESWHYSRSTHFGLTSGGACGFGLYGLCTKGSRDSSWIDPSLGGICSAFCTAYPVLCQDPTTTDLTLRGNFAAPNGDYYTQFWPSLPGDWDNYLSCGECFELVRTKADGTDYAPGEAGYTSPIILEVLDSCPCDANAKWCCGSGADHCAEIDFKYGCPLPVDSIHLDLSDIAMGRLQGNGSLASGVIPTRYKRVSCPVPGNAYIWLRDGGGPYYLTLSVVNTFGVGSVTSLEVMSAGSTNWTALIHDPNYTSSRPQERYGSWTIPQGSGPFNVPISVRVTNPAGEQIVSMNIITSFTAPATAPAGFHYIDLGGQFSS